MFEQSLGLGGAILVLIAYALMVFYPQHKQWSYSISLLGGLLLLVLAWHYQNVGLIVLEVSWVGINVWGLLHNKA